MPIRYTSTMAIVRLRIKRLSDLADVPAYQSEHAAGMDLHAAVAESIEIAAGEVRVIPCGFSMEVPVGFEAQVRPRSGLASKHAISMPNSPGTIDADYRGEVKVPLINLGARPFTVEKNMRIAQMVVAPVAHCVIEYAEELSATARGGGGFGSTGA